MTEKPVVFFDSGIGGLTYLIHAREAMKDEYFIYVADRKNFPYGDKSVSDVLKLVPATMEKILHRIDPKAVVIACNTASVIALAVLRKNFDIPFIGVVPAIKPAAENSKQRKIGIFATSRTVKDTYTEQLIRDFAGDCAVISYPGSETVTYIENRYFFQVPDQQREYIRELSKRFLRDGIDTLVLGCTHFVYLSDMLQENMRDSIAVIDSRRGVTRQLGRVLECKGLKAPALEEIEQKKQQATPGKIYTTSHEKQENSLFPLLAERYGLAYMGILDGDGRPGRAF